MCIDEVRVRNFLPRDKALVEAFFDQMGGESRAFFNRGSWNQSDALGYFDGKDEGRHVARWMALGDERMIGYVFLWELNRSIPWLGIAVAEDFKGRHLGRILMETARGHAMSHGKGGILLTTHVANLRGQSLYERCGYERMGMHTNGEVLYLLRF